MDFEKKVSLSYLSCLGFGSDNFSSMIVCAAGSLRYHGCSKISFVAFSGGRTVIYSALFLYVMEKNMGEQRRVSFAVNGWCDIL